ncbi:MAG TPA: ATP-binding protein [Candidatus Dormibacteraeota bacterium]|nr:ATP-binding protein [Candidatus Dormibacteraeota bacterium]
MLARFRGSFAAKLVALEVGTILVVSISLAALLVSARLIQTRELEQNVSGKAVEAFARDLDTAGSGTASLSQRMADFAPLAAEYGSADHLRLEALLAAEAATLPAGESLVALDQTGRVIVARHGGDQAQGAVADPSRWNALPLAGLISAGKPQPKGYLELAGGALELDGMSPVHLNGAVAGYILDTIDVGTLLKRIVPSGSGLQYSLFFDGKRTTTTLDTSVLGQAVPDGLGGSTSCGSFGTYQLAGKTYAGCYATVAQNDHVQVAADVDDSVFASQRLNDALVVLFATTVLATVLIVLAVLFARRYAVRPLTALAQASARLGAGDYDTSVDVSSRDDFGRLADTFNTMAGRIRENTLDLEQERARLDAAITSLSAVSRALTTTTAGKRALREAVLDAMEEITGAGVLVMFEGTSRSRPTAVRGVTAAVARAMYSEAGGQAVTASGQARVVRLPGPAPYRGWQALVVPMVYQERPIGALAAIAAESLEKVDAASLTVLASQATVALQNSDLFDRERQTVVRLQELDSMKSDFLATIQHELRTPLTAIMGMTDLLEMAWASWSDAQKLDAVNDVQLAAKSLFELVETILDYSLIESNRVTLHLSAVDPREAARTALEELGPLIKRQKANVHIRVPRDVRVQADQRRLTQVFKALIDNAVKFSPEGARVDVSAERQNGSVQLKVTDRGIGIDEENRARIFERFYQVDNTATRRYGGTGMGLALVSKLVAMHHGNVAVESRPGKGSTFTVVLPAVAPNGANGRLKGR